MPGPETRPSLLLKIRDPDDRDAWRDFTSIYRPVIYRMARLQGLQDADAEDLTQQVLVAVSQSIDRFEVSQTRGKFRSWLRTIAHRAIINAVTRRHQDRAIGGTDVMEWIDQQPATNDFTRLLTLQYRREIFRVAAQQIQAEFETETWQVFWETVVDGASVNDVAQRLGRSRGSVYTARSRVMARLKEKVLELDDRGEP